MRIQKWSVPKYRIFCIRCWLRFQIPHKYKHSPSIAMVKSFMEADIKSAMAQGIEQQRLREMLWIDKNGQ